MPRTHAPRDQYSIGGISRGLGLSPATYQEFYASVERSIQDSGWISSTFRSLSLPERRRTQGRLCDIVLADSKYEEEFPDTVKHIRTAEGQAAFGCLVYKICSNYRRRTKRKIVRVAAHAESDSSDCTSIAISTESSLESANEWSAAPTYRILRSAWHSMVTVQEHGGRLKLLCRLCELDYRWPAIKGRPLAGVDDMDFNRLIDMLKADCAFVPGVDNLYWISDEHGQIRIDNERQWRAGLSDTLMRGLSLRLAIRKERKEPNDT